MLRTQIYLPEELHSELIDWANKMKVPMAEVIRRIIKAGVRKKEEFFGEENDLLELAKLKIRGGPKDLSKNLDLYLYR